MTKQQTKQQRLEKAIEDAAVLLVGIYISERMTPNQERGFGRWQRRYKDLYERKRAGRQS